MDELDFLAPRRTPTGTRPLLGMTVLAVEDSRYACEALRLMCLRSGARIRRADCLRSARRHLQVYRPSIVIIDMGLPDGSGADLIEELNRAVPRVGVILATSGDAHAESAALAAGADGFLSKPLGRLAMFQQKILEHLPPESCPSGPRPLNDEVIDPDPMAYRDDMTHVANLLDDGSDGAMLDYVAQFLSGVAKSAEDTQLAAAANDLSGRNAETAQAQVARLTGLLRERLDNRIAI